MLFSLSYVSKAQLLIEGPGTRVNLHNADLIASIRYRTSALGHFQAEAHISDSGRMEIKYS